MHLVGAAVWCDVIFRDREINKFSVTFVLFISASLGELKHSGFISAFICSRGSDFGFCSQVEVRSGILQ